MSFYKYPVKDKHIRIYTEQELNGEAIKTYKHPEGTTIALMQGKFERAREIMTTQFKTQVSLNLSSIKEISNRICL